MSPRLIPGAEEPDPEGGGGTGAGEPGAGEPGGTGEPGAGEPGEPDDIDEPTTGFGVIVILRMQLFPASDTYKIVPAALTAIPVGLAKEALEPGPST